MNKRSHFVGLLTMFVLTTLACGFLDIVTNKAVGGDEDMTAVSNLWSDVPPMDGMTTAQQIDMPVWLKALARPIMDQMMRGLNDGADAGHWDWTSFSLGGKTPADVQAFYTPERMGAFSWQQADAACMPMSENAVLCSFTKEESGKTTGLLIIAAIDEQKKETSVFFLRAEGVGGTPAPDQSDQSSLPLSLEPISPISVNGDLTQIDVCQAIPQGDIEAVMGRKLVKAPERFDYYDTGETNGCWYEAEKDSDGEAHFGYVIFAPVNVYNEQPLYENVDVGGFGQAAYFNNGADALQLWVKVNDNAAFAVAFGDVPNEEGAKAIATLLLAAIQ